MKESDIEKYLLERVESFGGLCWKFVSPGTKGVPDRVVILNGLTVFIEVKAPGQNPRDLQVKRIQQIRHRDGNAIYISSIEEVDALVNILVGGESDKSI